jgi:hypothetical protein
MWMMMMLRLRLRMRMRMRMRMRIRGQATHDSAVGHADDHARGDEGDDKVPEPLGGSGGGETVVSGAVIED